ncbi:MAG: hypothetical protein V7K53_24065 [Nostoc sp.]
MPFLPPMPTASLYPAGSKLQVAALFAPNYPPAHDETDDGIRVVQQ